MQYRLYLSYQVDLCIINGEAMLRGGELHQPQLAVIIRKMKGQVCIQVDLSVINGEVVVRAGKLQTLDVAALVKEHNKCSAHICSFIKDNITA